jgi:GntR family transcriptional regulator
LDLKSRKSIYEQVVDNVKELIVTGIMPAESKLPSVRELSRTLTVNPNTVQKAYRELEHQGYIYTVTGLGCFVAVREETQIDEKRVKEIMEELDLLIRELMYLGIVPEDIKKKSMKFMKKGVFAVDHRKECKQVF